MEKDKLSLWFSHTKCDEVDTVELKHQVGEMHTWMRNLEQHLMSQHARLGAVEQRITGFNSTSNVPSGLNQNQNDLVLNSPVVHVDELTLNHINRLHDEMKEVNRNLTSLKQQEESFKEQIDQQEKLIQSRTKAHAVVMKVGETEIPLELSGIIGGFICFLVAGLVIFDATEIVLSPWFLTGIGVLLFGGTFLRTEFSVSILKKLSRIFFSRSEKTRTHRSDSTS